LIRRLPLPVILAAVLSVTASCGYRPLVGRLPDGSQSIYIPVVENKTPFRGIGPALTEALRIKTEKSGLRVVAGSQGAYRLRVTILEVNDEPGQLEASGGHLGRIDTIWYVRVEAVLENRSGRPVRGPRVFEAGGRSFSGANPTAEASLGHARQMAIQDDVADLIVEYLFQSDGVRHSATSGAS
jgi:hypothetical protein